MTKMTKTAGLNPFEFRAGIYLEGVLSNKEIVAVLIPLNSGLVFTCKV